MMESESRSVVESLDAGLVAADVGGLAAALSVVVAVATLGALLAAVPAAAPLLGGVALSLARDVGGNCDPTCMWGALGPFFAATGLPIGAPLYGASWEDAYGEDSDWGGMRDEQVADIDPPPLGPKDREWWYSKYEAMADDWSLMWASGSVGGVGLSRDASVGGDFGG